MNSCSTANISEDVDVAIVGAGPTGLTAACALQASGLRVKVIDRSPVAQENSRAVVIHASTLEAFDRIGVAESIVASGRKFGAFSIYEKTEQLIQVDFGALPTRFPFVVTIPQADTEKILANRFRSLGGDLVRSTAVLDIVQDASLVHITAVHDSGYQHEISAKYVIGADGNRSITRNKAGIAFPGITYRDSFMLADVRFSEFRSSNDLRLFFSQHGSVVVAELPGGIHRVMANVDSKFDAALEGEVQTLLDRRGPGGLVIEKIVWSSNFTISKRLAETYTLGRIILAGDAAHVHSPTGGQGMNMGVQDSVDLSERLIQIIISGAPVELLQDYSKTRRNRAKSVLNLTDKATKISNLKSPMAMKVRNDALRTVGSIPLIRRKIAHRVSGI